MATMTKTAIPDDRVLVQLYRRFSEEEYCAGWMSCIESDPDVQREFMVWLRTDHSKDHLLAIKEYEDRSLPTLRKLYAEVFGAAEAPKQPEGRGHHV